MAPSKLAALLYKDYLDELGEVSSEVIISPPDMREGFEEAEGEPDDKVVAFWRKMMQRYGKEEEYTKSIIDQFKYGEDPEILIVVDKLLTGFDAPRNTVLYLCRTLREHSLPSHREGQPLCVAKDYGYIVDSQVAWENWTRPHHVRSPRGLRRTELLAPDRLRKSEKAAPTPTRSLGHIKNHAEFDDD